MIHTTTASSQSPPTPQEDQRLSLVDKAVYLISAPAITFAEAGLPKSAREFLGTKQPVQQPLRLELPGVKIWFGTATING